MPTVTTRPQFLNANSGVYTAWDLRRAFEEELGEGVFGYEDFRVLPRQAGANMSVDIGKTTPGLMQAWVRGDTRGGQGLYAIDNIDRAAPTTDTYLAQLNEAVTANASGNPRLDQVILEVLDQQHAGASNLAQIRVVAGTPSVGATLDNRTGAAALPASALLLADVIVANGETTIDAVDIRDRRPFPCAGTIPPLLTDVDMVMFRPADGLAVVRNLVSYTHDTLDTHQAAALMYLPRRIVGATRIRWTYSQNATANTGSYVLAIFDASGRRIVDTGSVAFTGAASSWQERSETIAATTFEPGLYYVFVGFDTATASAQSSWVGVDHSFGSISARPAITRNQLLRSTSGGVTVPTTLLGFTDVGSLTAAINMPMVPVVALSVG